MKKVLVIAQYFPPAAGIATFRVAKFVKYLSEFGWEPVVITMPENEYHNLDDTLIKDIPEDLSIYKVSTTVIKGINDLGIRWIPSLIKKSKEIIEKEKPDVIFITAGPYFPLVVGHYIKTFYKIPYVVDLRDAWKIRKHNKPKTCKEWLQNTLMNTLEPPVIKKASKVIGVSNQLIADYKKAYPKETSSKFQVITNGYDICDYEGIDPLKFDKYTILYTGTFISKASNFRNPTNFFKSLKILKDKNLPIFFTHIGTKEQDVIDIAIECGVEDHVEFVGRKSFKETLAYIKGANTLLIIGGGLRNEQTGKVFDYLACNRPILALIRPDCGIADVLENLPIANIIENKNPDEIADLIEKVYLASNENIKTEIPEKFNRKNLTSELAKVLNDIIT